MRRKWFNEKEDQNKRKKPEIIHVYLQGRFYYKKKTSVGHLNVPDNVP